MFARSSREIAKAAPDLFLDLRRDQGALGRHDVLDPFLGPGAILRGVDLGQGLER